MKGKMKIFSLWQNQLWPLLFFSNTSVWSETAATCKSLKNSNFSPLLTSPLTLTNVLLNDLFSLLTVKVQAVAEVFPTHTHTMGLNCVWPLWRVTDEGLSFFWPSRCLEEGPLYTVFSLWFDGSSQAEWQADLCTANVCECVFVYMRVYTSVLFASSDSNLLKLLFIGPTKLKTLKNNHFDLTVFWGPPNSTT